MATGISLDTMYHVSSEKQEAIKSGLPEVHSLWSATIEVVRDKCRGIATQHLLPSLPNTRASIYDEASSSSRSSVQDSGVRGRKKRGATSEFVLATLPGSSSMFQHAEGCTILILSDTVCLSIGFLLPSKKRLSGFSIPDISFALLYLEFGDAKAVIS
jgi:hypothetical protein